MLDRSIDNTIAVRVGGLKASNGSQVCFRNNYSGAAADSPWAMYECCETNALYI